MNNRPVVTYGSTINKQVSFNQIPENPPITNDPNVRGIKGNEIPRGGDARQTGSILGATAGSNALSGLVNIASIGGPGTWQPECFDGDTHPNNICIYCENNKWKHIDKDFPCSLHAPGTDPFTLLPACIEVASIGCDICGPCYTCVNRNGVASCEDPLGSYAECLECNNSTAFCNGGNPINFKCEADKPVCCNGTCIDILECKYDDLFGVCQVGCNPLLLDCAKCEFGTCVPGAACGECQKCVAGFCVHDPDGIDNNGDLCGYAQSLLNTEIVP